MATITKKELIDRIAEQTQQKRVQVKRVVQQFLDEIIGELGKNNRLEFRDFGVFETKIRKARKAQNPKTLEPVEVALVVCGHLTRHGLHIGQVAPKLSVRT